MEENNQIKHGHVETFAEDMAKVIESDRGGLVKNIIHQEEEKERQKQKLSPESRKNKFFVIGGSVLFLVALGVLSYFIFRTEIHTVEIPPQFTPIIFHDESSLLDIAGLDKDKLAKFVFDSANETKVKIGGIEALYLVLNKQIIGVKEFLGIIKSSFVLPMDGATSIVSDRFLMGVMNNQLSSTQEISHDFFILLRFRSVAEVFNNMRIWEDKMFFDLHDFFGVNISTTTKDFLTKSFENGIVENKNARILYDQDHNVVIMYVFIDNNSVIITKNPIVVREVTLRLGSSQIKK